MIDLILLSLGFIGLVVASLFDIKTREVPDWLNYSLIASGLGIRLIYSLATNFWAYFLYALLALGIVFVLSSIMYYTKQWGGGDAKLLMALSTLFAYFPSQNLFLLRLIINILIAGSIYGILFTIYFVLKKPREVKQELMKIIKKWHKVFTIILILLLAVSLFIPDNTLRVIALASVILLLFYQVVSVLIKAIEKVHLFKTIPVSKLTEGDWVTKDIIINKKKIYSKNSPGIEKWQIDEFKKHKIYLVPIKEGIPFVPAFLFGFIITFILPNFVEMFI